MARVKNSAVRYWRVHELASVELLRAEFRRRQSARHAHEGYEMAVVERGIMRLRRGGSTFTAGPGDIVVIHPDEAHAESSTSDDGWSTRAIYPSIENLRDATAALVLHAGTPSFAEPIVRDADLRRRILALHHRLETRTDLLAIQTLAIDAAVTIVSRHSLRRDVREQQRAPAAVRRAIDYLEAHAARNVSLNELSAAAGLSAFHLARLFATHTGFPPHAYLTRIRLRRARALLAGGARPAQVAADVGFTDQAHLTHKFRQAFGLTPGQYAAASAYNS